MIQTQDCRNCGVPCGDRQNKIVILTGSQSHCEKCCGVVV